MLVDGFGRRIDYLRLSVTDRCDLRCTYCMPKGFKVCSEPKQWLDFDEIERLLGVFARLGLKRIRLTGGEPLLRKNLTDLVGRLAVLPGIDDLSLSTNGTQLTKYAHQLRQAGVTRLNVSLDSLDRDYIHQLTGRDVLPLILDGLDSASAAGFRMIKINMVATAGMSERDVDAMVTFCAERGFVLRLIETMPLGEAGRKAGFVDLQPIRDRLRARFGLIDGVVPGGGPARYLVSPDRRLQIGFITPISQHFCETCNRVRLSADGVLHLCLGQEATVDFRLLLRNGCSDEEITQRIEKAMLTRPERHEFLELPGRNIRIMSSMGG